MKIDYGDKALQGAIAGVVSGAIAEILSFISGALNISMIRYVDYAGILLLGHQPETIPQTIVATGLSFLFSAMVGIMFAYLLPHIGSTNLYFKSWIFTAFVWYVWYSLLVMTFTDKIQDISFPTAISNFVVTSTKGVFLGIIYIKLHERYKK